jgi:hypothetical protein
MILCGTQYLSISFISRPSICIKTISQSFYNNANLQNASTSTSFSPSLRRNSYSRHCPARSCAAVGIITARASTEAASEGIIGSLAAAIQSGSTQTVSRTLVDYPALLYPYAQSVQSGFAAITAKWDLLHAPSNGFFSMIQLQFAKSRPAASQRRTRSEARRANADSKLQSQGSCPSLSN